VNTRSKPGCDSSNCRSPSLSFNGVQSHEYHPHFPFASETFRAQRPQDDSRAALEELKASIAAHSLQQNLIVIKGERFEVVAGGRRLTALLELQAEGKVPEDYTAPCKLVGKDEAQEILLAENIVRAAMHPYDQFAAWKTPAEQGHTLRRAHSRPELGLPSQQCLDCFRIAPMEQPIHI
jgi:ParB-like nuclease domain